MLVDDVGGVGVVVAVVELEEAEPGEEEHLQRAAGEDHGGASDGVVEAVGEEAGDDDIDAALLTDPAGGGVQSGEEAVVDRGQDA